ncbi:MAG: radical SAM protein [Candidatus Rokubacteria bacterium]|nr:radical SAM protein [Candidatus Rokubacteria bacterium]
MEEATVPHVTLRELRAVWFQVTGTLCNLSCRHCFNASGPKEPWLAALDAGLVRRYLAEADGLGVREIYFTGGEPFLHRELLALLRDALAVAPTTVLTNGTLIDDAMADRLAALAAESAYSLEIRISVDAATAADNDAVRGQGSFARAIGAARRLAARELWPIVTATEIAGTSDGRPLYDRLHEMLLEAGVGRPRIKILPVLPLGRCADGGASRLLSAAALEGFDDTRLPCATTRVVADGGVYACPILAGLPSARLGEGPLAGALGPAPLSHPACVTCWATGLTCGNT